MKDKSLRAAMVENNNNIPVPTRAECLSLTAKYGMLPHIRDHSFLVTEVALEVGLALIETGLPLHLPLIEAGALLHDLGKTPCLGTDENHAAWGARVLAARGYSEVAQVVRQHVHLDENLADSRPLREAEVVNYADKRVLHTQVVMLAERFADLKARYGRTQEILARINTTEIKAQGLEEKIFRYVAFTPGDLLNLNHNRRTL